jgi:hypothetical protein
VGKEESRDLNPALPHPKAHSLPIPPSLHSLASGTWKAEGHRGAEEPEVRTARGKTLRDLPSWGYLAAFIVTWMGS